MINNNFYLYDLRCEYRKNPIGIDVLKPRLSWKINGNGRGIKQSSYRIQISLDDNFNNVIWDTGMIKSDQSVHLEYSGPELESKVRYYFRVMISDEKGDCSLWSSPSYWEMGLLKSEEWIADWITTNNERNPQEYEPAIYLRNFFSIKKKIKRARIYTSALGLYELNLNGSRVGDYYLTPGWTSYNKRLQYQTYDVSNLLKKGENALGIILGDGWYKGDLMWDQKRNFYGKKTAAILQLHLFYQDGKEEVITTNQNWKSNTGPILMSEIYHGETYDARKEMNGWDKSNFDDSCWSDVSVVEEDKDILLAQENEPVKIMEEITPLEVITTPAGERVIDMGQNMVGWVRFNVIGKAGDKVKLKHAEVLDKDGNFYTDNIRNAKQTITYILKGDGKETFEPRFTFQGFRYVKLENYPDEVSLDDFTGVVVYSDMDRIGSFSCSNPLINKLQENIVWGQKGNFVDIPTDCPQRDERLGWTGDAQVFAQTASFNMNVALFFSKWLRDLKTDQSENGAVPFVIPDPSVDKIMTESQHATSDEMTASAAWGDAAVICPWTIYISYGDKRILEEQYDSMKSWVDYIKNQGDNEYIWNTGFHFGDWLALDAKENSYVGMTSKDFIATAFYAYSTSLFVKIVEVLDREDDKKEYNQLLKKIIENFQQEFVTPNGRLSEPTQTAHALALFFDLVKGKQKQRVVDTLAKYVTKRDGHLTTGFVGTPYLCHVLSDNGYLELAYQLLEREEYPSWLYPVTKGATTMWEHWDGIKEDGSFWPEEMNSFNHYAYGAIGDWLYQVVAGIRIDKKEVGYKKTYIAPKPGGSLTSAEASIESMYGKIKSSWKIVDSEMKLDLKIPANTNALVVLPAALIDTVKENGILLKDNNYTVEGIYSCKDCDNGVELEIGSGEYCFKFLVKK